MRKIIFIILFILILPFNVQAADNGAENGTGNKTSDSEQVQRLYDYIVNMKTDNEVLKDLDVKDYVSQFMKTGDGKYSTMKVVKALAAYSIREITATFKTMSILIIIAIICALLNNLHKAFSDDGLASIAYFACFALIIVLVSKGFYDAVSVAKATMTKTADFMSALIPVLLMLVASVGGFVEASVMDPVIIAAINISIRLYMDIIIPIIFVSFVFRFVSNLSDEFKLSKLTKLLNQVAIWMQGVLVTIFVGVLTIRGITSSTIDHVTVKTAKYAVDNFIPLVGKALSDAISTVAGYSILLKNALSGVGLLIILGIAILPIIKLLVMALLYKLTAALIEPISDSKIVDCITSVGDSLILVMSCVISTSIMFFIMVSIIASTGKMMIGG